MVKSSAPLRIRANQFERCEGEPEIELLALIAFHRAGAASALHEIRATGFVQPTAALGTVRPGDGHDQRFRLIKFVFKGRS